MVEVDDEAAAAARPANVAAGSIPSPMENATVFARPAAEQALVPFAVAAMLRLRQSAELVLPQSVASTRYLFSFRNVRWRA
jgi:hypothetical protein